MKDTNSESLYGWPSGNRSPEAQRRLDRAFEDENLLRAARTLGPWTLRPRGFDRHYGTVLSAGACKIVIWRTQEDDYDPDGQPSSREIETTESHGYLGGHYESVSDLRIAEKLLAFLNRAGL